MLDTELAALTNVRLRLTFPAPAGPSGDLYGKVTGTVTRGGARLTRIHLTSVDAADRTALARLIEPAPAGLAAVSNATEVPR